MGELGISEQGLVSIPSYQVRLLRVLLVAAVLLLSMGLYLPMITLSKFVIARNSFSVFSGVVELLRDGQFLLFILVAGFSIVLPILKVYVLFRILSLNQVNNHKLNKYLHLMHEYGRWAMLDVMVVAVLITTVKLGAIASIKVHTGLFVFGGAVLLIMLITNRVVGLTQEPDVESEKR